MGGGGAGGVSAFCCLISTSPMAPNPTVVFLLPVADIFLAPYLLVSLPISVFPPFVSTCTGSTGSINEDSDEGAMNENTDKEGSMNHAHMFLMFKMSFSQKTLTNPTSTLHVTLV